MRACTACGGLGVCRECEGRGVELRPWHDGAPCAACAGEGSCAACAGSGIEPLVKPDGPSYTD